VCRRSGRKSIRRCRNDNTERHCFGEALRAQFARGESQVNLNPVTLKFNLSYYDPGVINSSSNSGSGGPSGKTTPQSLALHAALARFADLYGAVVAGGYSECSLEQTSANGDVILNKLKSFESVDALQVRAPNRPLQRPP
jgi:hypothetical protein